MASLMQRSLNVLVTRRWRVGQQAVCWYTQKPEEGGTSTKATQTPPQVVDAAPDLDNSTYKAEQYYAYNPQSYYDIDVEMSPHRIGQPSKYKPKQANA